MKHQQQQQKDDGSLELNRGGTDVLTFSERVHTITREGVDERSPHRLDTVVYYSVHTSKYVNTTQNPTTCGGSRRWRSPGLLPLLYQTEWQPGYFLMPCVYLCHSLSFFGAQTGNVCHSRNLDVHSGRKSKEGSGRAGRSMYDFVLLCLKQQTTIATYKMAPLVDE